MNKLLLTASMASLLAVPGTADARKRPAPVPVAPVAPRIAPTDPVELYYYSHNDAPIWTRTADSKAALPALVSLLQRAPAECLANRPALAASVQAALQAASTSNSPAANQALEFNASKAWVAYVQLMKKAPA